MEQKPAPSIQHGLNGKTDFGSIYDQPDPRAYFNELGAYDYEIPQHGKAVFRQVLQALPADEPTVVDLCCSYGINAALLKHDVDLADLYAHYGSEEVAGLSSEELAVVDRRFYSERRLPGAPDVIGLDAAAPAVDYALQVGLLDDGASENLEGHEPSPELAKRLAEADLLTVTGGIGYVTARTFDRLLSCSPPGSPPWVASLCLRTVSFDPIADCLASHGLVTEQLEDVTFPQRRFTSPTERESALTALARLGLNAEGLEAEGRYHANVYLARPVGDSKGRPVEDILTGLGAVGA